MNRMKTIGAYVVPAAALMMVLAGRAPTAQSAPTRGVPYYRPDRPQLVAYRQGLMAWEDARKARDPKARDTHYLCAEGHFVEALDGRTRFPEAMLALGQLNYELNRVYRAERAFQDTAAMSRGALKAEALTYWGVIALRRRDWIAARTAFTNAEAEDLSLTHTSSALGDKQKILAGYRARAERLRPARKVGIALATANMAVHPANPAPDRAAYEAALAAIAAMGPVDAAAFDGKNLALWRFPERMWPRPKPLPGVPEFPAARADWSLTIDSVPPAGVAPISPAQFGNAVRAYASGMLEVLRTRTSQAPRPAVPALNLPAANELTVTQDRRNAAMALVHRVLWLEDAPGTPQGRPAPDYAGARAALDQLAAYGDIPGVALMVRQHRIWIALEGSPNVDEAKRLIDGAGAQDDPLIYQEIESLAQKLLAANRREAALAEWRRIVAGVPTSQNAAVRAEQEKGRAESRLFAEWNLAADALNTGGSNQNPQFWSQALRSFPTGRGRENYRFYLALRWAEAVVRSGGPAADLRTALTQAEDIVRGRDGAGLPVREPELGFFAWHLAHLAHQANRQAMYAEVLRARSDYYPWIAATNATTSYRQVPVEPAAGKIEALRRVIAALKQIASSNQALRPSLQGFIAQYEKDLAYNEDVLARIGKANTLRQWATVWNEAAEATRNGNIQRTSPDAWQQAADAWQRVVEFSKGNAQLPGYYPEPGAWMTDFRKDQSEAGRQHVMAMVQKTFRLRMARQRDEARAAVQATRTALDSVKSILEPATADRLEFIVGRLEKSGTTGPGRLSGRVPYIPVANPPRKGATPRNARGAILSFGNGEWPNVRIWLAKLSRGLSNPGKYPKESRALDALVQWFNHGHPDRLAEVQAGGERIRNGWTRETLLSYLKENVHMAPGRIPVGTVQYGYRGGQWVPSTVKFPSYGYFLKGNNRVIIHAFCSNAMDVITVSSSSFVPPPVAAEYRRLVPVPVHSFWQEVLPGPTSEWEFGPAYPMRSTTWGVAGPTFPVCPPAVTLLIRAQMTPKLPVPDALPPHCSPTRITIGTISSIDARNYLIRTEKGTAENRKR